MSECRVCDGTEWVCENHNDRPWEGCSDREDACHCGAGEPCWICNREMALAGPLWKAREIISDLMKQIDHSGGCCCSFPTRSCCSYSRAETYLSPNPPKE